MPHDNIFYWLITALQDIVNRYNSPYTAEAMNWWFNIAAIMTVVVGARLLLDAGNHQPIGPTIGIFTVRLALSHYLIASYDSDFFGTGASLHKIITGTGADLANIVDHTMADRVAEKFGELLAGTQPAGVTEILTNSTAWMHYWALLILSSLMQGAVVFVTSWGPVVSAVLVVLGPLTFPFLLVPGLVWIPTGWFRSLIQYSFYPVVANIFVYVYGLLIINYFTSHPGPYTSSVIAGMLVFLLVMVIACIFGILKINTVVSDLFHGQSGHSVFPGIGGWR